MKTPKQLYHSDRVIYKPELPACPHCGGPLVMYNYLVWDKTVQTLDGVLSIASRPGHCTSPLCPGYHARFLSAEGQQIAPGRVRPGSKPAMHVLATQPEAVVGIPPGHGGRGQGPARAFPKGLTGLSASIRSTRKTR